ncbi:hypothetical protein scyTo_0008398, partial [Scyliorhinus torazame]|nr:hypothetical protein [Scyliorhinus torazame]
MGKTHNISYENLKDNNGRLGFGFLQLQAAEHSYSKLSLDMIVIVVRKGTESKNNNRNGSVLTVLTLGAFLSVSWFASRLNLKGGDDDEETAYQHTLQELSNKMHKIEEENVKHSVEMKLVLDNIKHIIAVERRAMSNTSRNLTKVP